MLLIRAMDRIKEQMFFSLRYIFCWTFFLKGLFVLAFVLHNYDMSTHSQAIGSEKTNSLIVGIHMSLHQISNTHVGRTL